VKCHCPSMTEIGPVWADAGRAVTSASNATAQTARTNCRVLGIDLIGLISCSPQLR